MKELIDLYSKLVIGTFTFIEPSFTLVISLFSKQLEKATNKNKERLITLVEIGAENKDIANQISNNWRETNLLKPKRQVLRLFGSLLLSLYLTAGILYHN